jgi:hypothetical protein
MVVKHVTHYGVKQTAQSRTTKAKAQYYVSKQLKRNNSKLQESGNNAAILQVRTQRTGPEDRCLRPHAQQRQAHTAPASLGVPSSPSWITAHHGGAS